MKSTALPGLAMAAASTALTLGLLEGAARIARRFEGAGKEQRSRLQYVEHDRLLGWRKRPGARALFDRRDYRVEVVVNSQGLRDRVRAYDRPAGTLRVLLLGDSFVEGYSVPFEQSVGQVLERRLVKPGCPVEVINGGTVGYSTDQEYLFYRSEGARYGAQTSCSSSISMTSPVVLNFPVPPPGPEPPRPPPEAAGTAGSAALDWVRARLQRSAPRWHDAVAATGLWAPIRRLPPSPELRVYRRRPPSDVRLAWAVTERSARPGWPPSC